MNTNLLRSWLGLPPGPWPPDDRALLGLPAGPVDAADAERRALVLMGRLRPHQLVHPDLVTEGMNRLAQALLAVTATASAPPPTRTAPERTQVDYSVGLEPPPSEPLPLQPQPAPAVIEPEPVLDEESPFTESRDEPVVTTSVPRPEPPLAAVGVAPEIVGPSPADRRAAYRELAGLRGLLRAWDRLRTTVADPSAGLTTPGEVFEFLEGVQAVRGAVIHPGLSPDTLHSAAPAVAAIVRQPLPLAVFRSLVPAQRKALSRDWATARATFVARAAALRAGASRAAPARPTVTWAGLMHTMSGNPEWVLIAASGLVLAAVAVRLVTR